MVILAYKLQVIHSVVSHLRKYYFNDDRVELFLKSHKNFEDSNESDNIVHYYTRIYKGLVLLVPSLHVQWMGISYFPMRQTAENFSKCFLSISISKTMQKTKKKKLTLSFYNNEPSKNKHFLILLSSLARNSQEPKLKIIFEIP